MIAYIVRILALALMLALLAASRVLALDGPVPGPALGEARGGPSASLCLSSPPPPRRG